MSVNQEIVIKLETLNNVTIFRMDGDLTTFSEPFLKEAYENANNQGAEKILLRFSDDAYINSGGIALLIQMLSQTSQNNQLVAITGLSAHFQKIFKMVGINKFATLYGSVDEAIQKMSE